MILMTGLEMRIQWASLWPIDAFELKSAMFPGPVGPVPIQPGLMQPHPRENFRLKNDKIQNVLAG